MMKTCFQKSTSAVGMGALLILCLTVMTVLAQSEYAKRTADAAQGAAAANVLKKIIGPPDKTMDLFNNAEAAKPGALAVVKVSMRNMQFNPQTLKVKKGTVVEWNNEDLVPHTATSASFDSGTIGPGKSWRYTFTKAGQFSYTCTFHPLMTGVVTVK